MGDVLHGRHAEFVAEVAIKAGLAHTSLLSQLLNAYRIMQILFDVLNRRRQPVTSGMLLTLGDQKFAGVHA